MSRDTKREELAGWKQIASYLGVSIPTARDYYKHHGLPVIRRGGRYYASKEALDEWVLGGSSQRHVEPRRPQASMLLLLLAVAFAGVMAIPALRPKDYRPEAVNIENLLLRVFDRKGDKLWEVPLSQFQAQELEQTPPLLRDVDADGRNEVIFNAFPINPENQNGRLICFDEDGDILWQQDVGRRVNVGDRRFEYFATKFIGWLDAKDGGLILSIARHNHWFPTQVALLEPRSGAIVAEYWHPGFIYSWGVRDTGEEQELWLGGTNNPGDGPGHPSLAILPIPFGPPSDHDSLFGFPNPQEKTYVLFPRQDLAQAMGFGTAVYTLSILEPNRIVLGVGHNQSIDRYLYYTVDADFNLIDFRPSDNFKREHNQRLDHRLTASELDNWRTFLRFSLTPDGNSPEVLARFQHGD